MESSEVCADAKVGREEEEGRVGSRRSGRTRTLVLCVRDGFRLKDGSLTLASLGCLGRGDEEGANGEGVEEAHGPFFK